jgi:hypothetical protein
MRSGLDRQASRRVLSSGLSASCFSGPRSDGGERSAARGFDYCGSSAAGGGVNQARVAVVSIRVHVPFHPEPGKSLST